MSATNVPGSFDPSNPFGSQKGGVYDQGAIQGLYLRAKKGDLAARKYLQGIGFLGDQGQEVWNPDDMQAGDWQSGVNAWAKGTGSTPYTGAGFQFSPNYINDSDPTFAKTWDQFYQTGGTGQDFGPANVTPKVDTAANPFGASYQDPGGGWNPVSLLDARQGYDGTAVDGWYNQKADTGRPWGPNGKPELDRARVWRMTMDDLKGDFSDQAKVNATFLTNVARLRRDIIATYGEQAWQGSAFANYDRMPGAQITAASPASTAADPSNPQQTTTINTNPDGTPKATPSTATYTNPTTGATTNYDPTSNSALLNIPLVDPQNDDARLAYVMRKFGLDPTRAGLYTGSIARALSPQIEAASQLNGLYGDRNAVDTARQNLDEFTSTLSRPGGFGALQQNARGLLADPRLQGLASGLGAPQQISTLQTLLSQAYAGGNAIYNQSRLGRFNQALGQGGEFAMQSLDNPALNDPLNWLQSTEWADMLRGY
jgi:hypothetical protein